MPYVVTPGCNRDGACLVECATDSIEEGIFTDADGTTYNQMYINPDTCIDCGNCEVVCEQHAIYADTELPKELAHMEAVNRAFIEQK